MTDVVIVGAGVGGITTAIALRSAGYAGTITIFGQETTRPYDRPPLSKNGLTDDPFALSNLLTPEQQFDEKIDLQLGQVVTSIDRAAQIVTLGSGQQVAYGSLVIATGATARPLPIDGGHHALLLRSDADARRIRDALTHNYSTGPSDSLRSPLDPAATLGSGPSDSLRSPLDPAATLGSGPSDSLRSPLDPARTARLVVIGGGFIGLEVAASARSLGCDVTVIEAGARLMTRGMPPEISAVAEAAHRKRGINISLNAVTQSIAVNDDASFTVMMKDGHQHRADVVVAGVGAIPNISLAEAALLSIDNGIAVDQHLRTSDPMIFAIGDCCSFVHNGQRLRLEAWRNAVDQANTVAQIINGNTSPFHVVPWFWSDQYDLGLQVSGLPHAAVSSVVRTRDDGAVVWFGLDQSGVLVSAAAIGEGTGIAKDIRLAERLIAAGATPAPHELSDPTSDLKQLVKKLLATGATP
jgi:3-phenylpropionate/trans-cinnamate dioxygenase ferredoxin reductase component